MRVVAQRVTRASVAVHGSIVGQIGRGLLLLVGVTQTDSESDASFLANKVANLRVFDDDAGQMNRSLLDLISADPGSAGALVVSQFTLYADARKGRRPSYIRAAGPEHAAPLVESFASALVVQGIPVERGTFGAEMTVELVNDGPVTIWLDTAELRA
jgi:D-tyrosyl-tRNA(Tyr) deacylase